MNFVCSFQEVKSSFPTNLIEDKMSLSVDLGEIAIVETAYRETYNGDYTVTPQTTEQKLLTKEKVMSDDVTIKEIPFYAVSNPSGGNTIYIGDKI